MFWIIKYLCVVCYIYNMENRNWKDLYSIIEDVIHRGKQDEIDTVVAKFKLKIHENKIEDPNEPRLLVRTHFGNYYWMRFKFWFTSWEEFTDNFHETPVGIFYGGQFLRIHDEHTYDELYDEFKEYYDRFGIK